MRTFRSIFETIDCRDLRSGTVSEKSMTLNVSQIFEHSRYV